MYSASTKEEAAFKRLTKLGASGDSNARALCRDYRELLAKYHGQWVHYFGGEKRAVAETLEDLHELLEEHWPEDEGGLSVQVGNLSAVCQIHF